MGMGRSSEGNETMPLAATIDLLDRELSDRAERTRVERGSTLREEGGAPREVLVHDLSRTGFRFSSSSHIAIGATVRLGLAGAGSANARVVRRDGDDHGCEFHWPLTAAQLDSAFTYAEVSDITPGDEMHVDDPGPRWPRIVRLAIFVIGGAAAWAAVFALVKALG
jgi:PilZ domain